MFKIERIRSEEDFNKISKVHFKSWEETYIDILGNDFFKNRSFEQQLERTRNSFKNGNKYYIAVADDNVVGFISYGICKDKDLTNCGEIYALYVLNDYHNKGIGKELLNHVLNDLNEYNQISLWMFKDNIKALNFYKHYGFVEDGKQKTIKLGKDIKGIRLIKKHL